SVGYSQYPPSFRLVKPNREDTEEIVLKVQGILCNRMLPPVPQHCIPKSIGALKNLRQHVKLTGLSEDTFDNATRAISEMHAWFQEAIPNGTLNPIDFVPFEGHLAIEAHARYFTDRSLVPYECNAPFMPFVDPNRTLQNAQIDCLLHASDNQVEYCVVEQSDMDKARYRPTNPASFRSGDIVEIAFNAVCIPIRNDRHKLYLNLRALSLISTEERLVGDGHTHIFTRTAIVQLASALDLRALSVTSRELRRLSEHELSRCANDLFEEFGMSASSTLLQLDSLGAVVSGSAAPSMIDPGLFRPNDLDIYLPVTSGSAFKEWVEESYGFKQVVGRDLAAFGMKGDRNYCGITGIDQIWYFTHQDIDRPINAILTTTISPLPAITAFHSTLLMNFVTYYGVVSLYPELTRRRAGWLNRSQPATRKDSRWIEKYQQRGFRILQDSRLLDKHTCSSSPSCTQTTRSLFDEGVAVAKFREFRYVGDITLLKSTERTFVWKGNNNRCRRLFKDGKGWSITYKEYIEMA
ncbi:hypothetical protein BKA70DRAFT_1127310, partial [Coprinopsis sp. MPI-PUGE-AT-0042]